jgi:hypothetical protein
MTVQVMMPGHAVTSASSAKEKIRTLLVTPPKSCFVVKAKTSNVIVWSTVLAMWAFGRLIAIE